MLRVPLGFFAERVLRAWESLSWRRLNLAGLSERMAPSADISKDSTLDGSRALLQELAGQLAAFLAGSEDVFLDAGSRLTGLERQARSLVDVSQGAVTQSSDQDHDPVESFDRELVRLERYLGASREASGAGLQDLSRILAGAEAITGARGECEDITRTMRVLGIYTRIENSRAEVRSGGMETVVTDVRRLGDQVDSQFQAMLAQARSLGETAAGARATAEGFRARQGAWSAQLLDETRGAMESLRALGASEAAVASRAISASEEVVRNVAEVLVALQIHDAIRQRIEHAVEELGAFERDAGSARLGGPLDAGAWLSDVFEVCRLVAAQLRGARERLVDGLGHIAESLRAMASRVADVAKETERLAGTGADGSPVERVQRGVTEATGVLREHLAHEQELTAALGRVAETAQGIGTHVRDLQRIGRDVKLIALNALVETERTGHGGRVLAVLAHGIGVLAVEVVKRTTAVSQTLQTIRTAAGALGHAAGTGSEGSTLVANLESLVTLLRRYHGDLQASAAALRDGSQALRDEVEGLAGRLAEQIAAAGALQRIEEELQRLGEQAAALGRPAAGSPRPLRQSSVLSRYTMDAEREIHQRVLEHGASVVQAEQVGPANGGLGDNVELF